MKILSKFSLVVVIVWFGFEVVLFLIFVGIEGGEFLCFCCNISNMNDNVDFIKEKCFGEYEQKYIKFFVCGFVIINFLVIVFIFVIYFQCVKLRIYEFEICDVDVVVLG